MARTAIDCPKNELIAQINKVIESGEIANMGDLCKVVANTDWAKKRSRPITNQVVYSRIRQFGIKTGFGGKKGRTTLPVDKSELVKIIEQVEANNTFSNRYELWQAIANTDWAKNHKPKPVTASIAMLRAIAYDIPLKTTKGKRGGDGSQLRNGKRRSRADKFNANPEIVNSLSIIGNAVPRELKERFTPVVEAVKNGSMKAAVKLKCLDCSNYQPKEIKLCPVNSCPLWAFRPFQMANTKQLEELDEKIKELVAELDEEDAELLENEEGEFLEPAA